MSSTDSNLVHAVESATIGPSKRQRKLDFKPAQKRKSSRLLSSEPITLTSSGSRMERYVLPHGLTSRNRGPPPPDSETPKEQIPQQQIRTVHPIPKSRMEGGKRQLVVRNFKGPTKEDSKPYYEKCLREVEGATIQVLANQKCDLPLEILYRNVEDLVRDERGEQVMSILKKNMKEHLDSIAGVLRNDARNGQLILPEVVEKWSIWQKVTALLRSVFGFLDYGYLLRNAPSMRLLDHCTSAFTASIAGHSSIKPQILSEINQIIANDRKFSVHLSEHDSSLLNLSIEMLTATKLYGSDWEPTFLAASKCYFQECANNDAELDDCIGCVTGIIQEESERCATFNFDSTTRITIQKLAQEILVEKRQEFFLQEDKVGEVLKKGDVETIKRLYNLLKGCNLQEKLKAPWVMFVKTRGFEICASTNKSNAEKLIAAVLEFKSVCDNFVTDAFENDKVMTKGMKEAFISFINSRHAAHPWGQGGSKVGELLAKYCDFLLRGGLNSIPENLAHSPVGGASQDVVSGVAREKALEKHKSQGFDRQIDIVIALFKYIDAKDSFRAYYKLFLARRLLNARIIDIDIEQSLVSKLEKEMGEDWTKDLVTMFKDLDRSADLLNRYNEEVWGGRQKRLDLGVQVLSQDAWPKYPTENNIRLPHIVAKEIERYDSWYCNLHSGRKVSWIHSLAQAEVRANLPRGKRHLILGGLQAIVLVLFNDMEDCESLSYAKIQAATGMISAELDRTLASLACGKVKILLKEPPKGGIASTDIFHANLKFTSDRNRIKIPQVKLRDEGLAEVAEIKQVIVDRAFEVDAAIMRTLKNAPNGRLSKEHLARDVNKDIIRKGRDAVDVEELLKAADKLLKKEYIDLDGEEFVYLA